MLANGMKRAGAPRMFNDRKFVVIGVGMLLIWAIVLTAAMRPWQYWPFFALCGKDNCNLQGWLSALSGWAGAAAAAVTLFALLTQIKEANRHQRENLELQIRGAMTTASKVIELHNYIESFPEDKLKTDARFVRIFANAYDLALLQKFDAIVGYKTHAGGEGPETRYKKLQEYAALIEVAGYQISETNLHPRQPYHEMVFLKAELTRAASEARFFLFRWEPRLRES